MIVYIVEFHDYDESGILTVWSSLDEAEAEARRLNLRDGTKAYSVGEYHVQGAK